MDEEIPGFRKIASFSDIVGDEVGYWSRVRRAVSGSQAYKVIVYNSFDVWMKEFDDPKKAVREKNKLKDYTAFVYSPVGKQVA